MIAAFVCLIWFVAVAQKEDFCVDFLFQKKPFLLFLNLCLGLIAIAVCLNAWARFVSPGYDLYWFSQVVTNAKLGYGLHIQSERPIYNHLSQHWEPILYTAVPLTWFLKGPVAVVLWQAIGFWLGTIGAWKFSWATLGKTNNTFAPYLATLLYVFGFATLNPISFDIHPPVFGGLLFVPWILFLIVCNQNKLLIFSLLFLLMQCGEIYFAVVPAYFAYFILNKKITRTRLFAAALLYIGGFLLIGFYRFFVFLKQLRMEEKPFVSNPGLLRTCTACCKQSEYHGTTRHYEIWEKTNGPK